MFAEFGQVPMSLQLDFDSYEDSPAHIAIFRRRSGWLMAARATIQSEHNLLSSKLVVACFEHSEPIPSWRALHLTQCSWNRLEECRDEHPDLLDELMCEEEGAFFSRWQRETNGDLATLHDRTERQIEILEGRYRARMREIERQIAELRRRRRHIEASPETRLALTAIIADLEAENDEEAAQLISRRRRILNRAEASEEALWRREDILFETEPLYVIHWRDGGPASERALSPVWKAGHFYAPTRPEVEFGKDDEAAVLAKAKASMERNAARQSGEQAKGVRLVKPRLKKPPKPSPARQAPSVGQTTVEADRKLAGGIEKKRQSAERTVNSLADLLHSEQPGTSRWDKLNRRLAQAKRELDHITCQLDRLPGPERVEQPAIAKPPPPSEEAQLLLPGIDEDLQAKRAALVARLNALKAKGRKFLPGSPKTQRNELERAEVNRQIAALDRRISSASSASHVSRVDGPDSPARKEHLNRVLNLEALLEHHRPYTGDWFRLQEKLKEARARLAASDDT